MARPTPQDDEIAKLKDELSSVRMGVLLMLRNDFARMFSGYYDCKDDRDVSKWLDDVVDKVISTVEPTPAREMGDYGSSAGRALCPLCGNSASNIYDVRGFAYPDGLSWHLRGLFNAKQCFVTKVATDLALSRISQ